LAGISRHIQADSWRLKLQPLTIAEEEFAMNGSRTIKHTLLRRVVRSAALTLIAIGLLFAAAGANAACGDPRGSKTGVVANLPFLAPAINNAESGGRSIVGLWHVTYTSGGQLFYEAFDMWHSDGTEFENANLTPIEGNVCEGAWRATKTGMVLLSHVGWSFDASGNPNGSFTLTQANIVAHGGNSYQGTFDYKLYDLNGTLQFEATGTQKATRISAN
jgi:hypothetical protein